MRFPHGLSSNLISFWPLHEASGNRGDMIGSQNTLTDTNTVTQSDGQIEKAGQFTAASSESLNINNNSTLQTGDVDFTFAAWVYMDSKPAAIMDVLSKYAATAGNAEYIMYWNNTTDRFNLVVYRATDSPFVAVANTLGAPSTATWYFITAWHDSNADTVNIEINNGGVDSTATTGALQAAGTGNFAIGALATGSQYWNGRICEVGFWKRILTLRERFWLYNRGLGRTYPFGSGGGIAGISRSSYNRSSRGHTRLTGVSL